MSVLDGTRRPREDAQGPPPALSIDDLWVSLPVPGGTPIDLVRAVNLDVRPGESLGIVGESGAGKSLTCYASLGLVDRMGLVTRGEVTLGGRVISGLPARELSRIRGRDISIIFQEPSVSLNPSFRVGAQIAEVVRWHTGVSRKAAWERAVECLSLVGVPNPRRRAKEFPHTLSGGLRQRAMIALAIACEPKVLIADEATTALDVTIQAQILDLLRDLQDRLGMALVVVTHDLGVVADICDRVAVMYAGQIVDQARVDALFYSPSHPYTQGLLDSVPTIELDAGAVRGIPGAVPPPDSGLPGCWFAPRCSHSIDVCTTAPPELRELEPGRFTRCIRSEDVSLPGVRRQH